MKKSLKIGLIIGTSFLIAGGARAGLTKVGIIPNWFDIEILCPGSSMNIDFGDYDRTDPNCSSKCSKECEKHKDESFGYLCGNECISKCQIPKRNNCLDNCEIPDMGKELNSYYSLENYHHWCEENYTGTFECHNYVLLGGGDSLSYQQYYDEWVDSMFDGYQEELKYYELCRKSCGMNPAGKMVKKPIIYLYPNSKTQVNVTLGNPEKLSHTYPKYNSEKGRNVIAQPNGDLEDIETGRKLYALYREGKSENKTNFDEGFVVAGEDIVPFLEEKLAILGLNEREAEEFIVYWLPQMENNKYNLIRFETIEEQDENMPLNITPKPDTVIRIMMDWKAIDEPIDIPEQQLITPERSGFTVVEWGGSTRN